MKTLTPVLVTTLSTTFCALTLLLTHSAINAEGLYKWTDARGNTQYGDQPPANAKAKAIDLPKITIIDNYADQWKPMKFDEQVVTDDAQPTQPTTAASTYTKLAFLAPKAGQGIRANDGDVSAMVSIKPPLKKGHQLVFSIDGKPMAKSTSRTANFSNLNRGSHSISVKVINKKGKTLKSSSVGFNVLRTNPLNNDQPNQTNKLRQAIKSPQAQSFQNSRQQQIQNGK